MMQGPSGPKEGAFFEVQKREPEATSAFCVSRQVRSLRVVIPAMRRIVAADFVGALAEHKHQFRFVIEAGYGGRPRHIGAVAGQAGIQFDEAGGFAGHFLDQVVALQFLKVGAVVLADAEEFVGIGNRWQVMHVGVGGKHGFVRLGGVFAGEFERGAGSREAGLTQRQQAFHRGGNHLFAVVQRTFAGNEVEHPAVELSADTRGLRCGEQGVGGQSHC